jgi:transcriptional regulator with XRE-family HTH domain
MQTIGERLEEARKKKGISIREAAEATKIRGDYLQKFESNHFDIGLTEIYTRGFLRTYANFLQLPADRILNDYAALGRGDVRPRQPNREIYGRMDISISTAENAERATPPAEAAPEPAPAARERAAHRPRSGSSLPTGPDPATVFKYLKWGGGAVVVILLIVVINAMFSGRRSPSASEPRSSSVVSRGPTITLIALRPVQVVVSRKRSPEDVEGEPYFTATLAAGESRPVARPGAVYIEAKPLENLDFEINGKRYNLAAVLPAGVSRGELPAPAPER